MNIKNYVRTLFNKSEYLTYDEYKNKVSFIDTLHFQQTARKSFIPACEVEE